MVVFFNFTIIIYNLHRYVYQFQVHFCILDWKMCGLSNKIFITNDSKTNKTYFRIMRTKSTFVRIRRLNKEPHDIPWNFAAQSNFTKLYISAPSMLFLYLYSNYLEYWKSMAVIFLHKLTVSQRVGGTHNTVPLFSIKLITHVFVH